MTTFATKMSAAIDRLLANYGQDAVHTAADDTATDLTASFIEDPPFPGASQDGESNNRRATATILAADVAGPVADETLTAAGEIWTIESRTPLAGGYAWELKLVRVEIGERSRQAYRLRRP